MALARTVNPSARETEARLVYKAGSRVTQRNLERKKKKKKKERNLTLMIVKINYLSNNCFEIELFLTCKRFNR